MDQDDRPIFQKLRRKRPRNPDFGVTKIDNSLSSLTSKFISLIKGKENQSIDSKEAATVTDS